MCELKSRWYEGTKNQEGPQGPNERWPPQTTSYVVVPFSCTPQTKNTPLFKSPAWGTRKRNNYFCSFCLEYLLGLNREFDKLLRFSSCSIETGRCVSPLLYCRACVPTEPPKSPVSQPRTDTTTAALRLASWSSRECCQLVAPSCGLHSDSLSLVVSLTILWITPASLPLFSKRGGVSPLLCFCVGVHSRNHSYTRQHGRSHYRCLSLASRSSR